MAESDIIPRSLEIVENAKKFGPFEGHFLSYLECVGVFWAQQIAKDMWELVSGTTTLK